MIDILKYLTPNMITFLTVFGILLILIIVIGLLLVVFRNKPIPQKIFWVCKELVKIFSNLNSFFSQKRIQQGLLFSGGYFILIHHYWITRNTISTYETCEIALLLLGMAGYHLSKVQEEKFKEIQEGKSDVKTSANDIASPVTSVNGVPNTDTTKAENKSDTNNDIG